MEPSIELVKKAIADWDYRVKVIGTAKFWTQNLQRVPAGMKDSYRAVYLLKNDNFGEKPSIVLFGDLSKMKGSFGFLRMDTTGTIDWYRACYATLETAANPLYSQYYPAGPTAIITQYGPTPTLDEINDDPLKKRTRYCFSFDPDVDAN